MAIVLNNTQEHVERAIYSRLLSVLVELGHAIDYLERVTATFISWDIANNLITISGDHTADLFAGKQIEIPSGVAQEGTYTVVSSTYSSPNTTIEVTSISGTASPTPSSVSWYKYQKNPTDANRVSQLLGALDKKVDLYGVGPSDKRGIVHTPRIAITTQFYSPGSLGNSPAKKYELSEDSSHYISYTKPPLTDDLLISIHLVSSTIEDDRLLNSIMGAALPSRQYMDLYDNSGKFLLLYSNQTQDNDVDQGLLVRMHNYMAVDLYRTADTRVDDNIAKLSDVNIKILMDGEVADETNP